MPTWISSGPSGWQAERTVRPPSRVIMGYIRNMFAKVEFKCPPAAAIGRSEFEEEGGSG